MNYGNSENIRKLVTSLKKNPPSGKWELIIVDNDSPNNDTENLDLFFAGEKNIKIIKLPKNLGFGAGNEKGVEKASGQILAIINPDIEIKKDCLNELLNVLNTDEKVGIAVPQLLNPDGSPQTNARNFPTILGLLGHRIFKMKSASSAYLRKDTKEGGDIVPIDWAQGSFLVMRKNFFLKKLKGFDPRFFLFFEDTDLCRRTWEMGKRVVKVKKAQAYHGTERLSGGNLFLAIRKKTFWIHLHSAMKYFWKYLGKKKPEVF